ncbi:hypothetical protein CORC01_14185 [Colletotrichum orchidophilum]|uniref:Uncharacterized protein n=1 Tax=Colletotrichum orchidophilum TaxID=1209926 RepID=A0A1G4AN47_9PEZI|nr:uncharacterized protein CORC01_14185 [Colletotrichum orchidophilum]OHE90516.1 hypothetical protein CORC01_14185 [Colletotrichum orchidophilum]
MEVTDVRLYRVTRSQSSESENHLPAWSELMHRGVDNNGGGDGGGGDTSCFLAREKIEVEERTKIDVIFGCAALTEVASMAKPVKAKKTLE